MVGKNLALVKIDYITLVKTDYVTALFKIFSVLQCVISNSVKCRAAEFRWAQRLFSREPIQGNLSLCGFISAYKTAYLY